MIKYGKSNNEIMNRKLRLPIFTSAIIFASIVSATTLASSSSSLLSLARPYEKPFFAFAETSRFYNSQNYCHQLIILINIDEKHSGIFRDYSWGCLVNLACSKKRQVRLFPIQPLLSQLLRTWLIDGISMSVRLVTGILTRLQNPQSSRRSLTNPSDLGNNENSVRFC